MKKNEGLFELVVIGSSAGGIEALSTIGKSLPKDFPLPIVIAQHLDPHRPSHLADILSRRAQLPVVSVETSEVLQPGIIYVVPSNRNVQITPGEVMVVPDAHDGPHPSIDRMLSSAAEIYGEKLIAVILTGTGSDGTAGAQLVSDNGGTVIIQNPATAAFSGMPLSLASQTVDIIAELPEIGGILTNLASGIPIPPRPDMEKELQAFLMEVRENSNVDFRTYKTGTILRRLQRRIAATGSTDLTDYKKYLQTHPDEYGVLVKSFLIKVTEFMRDPEFYNFLGEQILPEIILNNDASSKELRFWSAGCATGEEAYSLAILVSEALGSELSKFTVKIFATDLDSEAIAFARRGIYPQSALQKLSDKQIDTYFNLSEKGYEVKKQIRSLVVFGEHDLGRRAPFPRIDLVLCRNVLIYFSRELQQHALKLFAFALREGGFLALGRAETVSPQSQFFVSQEPRLKIYQRRGRVPVGPLVPPLASTVSSPNKKVLEERKPSPELTQLKRTAQENQFAKTNLLLNLPIGVVVVNRNYDIQEINLAARRMLRIHTTAIGEDFVHLAEFLPNRELVNAITHTLREKVVSTLAEIQVPHILTGEPTFLQLSCYPQFDAENPGNVGVLILITDVTPAYQVKLELKEANDRLTDLETKLEHATTAQENADKVNEYLRELLEKTTLALKNSKDENEQILKRHTAQMEILVETNDELLAANEEQATSITELRKIRDDFLLRNEEFQAALEEAETLNEEMQATNEELETLNEEMQATVEELNTTNSDLVAQGEELQTMAKLLEEQREASEREKAQLALILASMDDSVLVVDSAGNKLLTNVAYQSLFEQNGSVQFLDDSGNILLEEETPASRAARGEKFSMTFKLKFEGGKIGWGEAVGHPLNSGTTFYGGVVVIRDTTERRLADEALRASNLKVTSILESISDSVLALDSQAYVTYVNNTAQEFVGRPLDELLGKPIWEMFPELKNTNAYLQLNNALTERKAIGYETTSIVKGKWIEVKVYPVEDGDITVYFRDITQRKLEEKQRLEGLGVLAGGIAHDFNNLLAILTGNLGHIRLELEEEGQKENILSSLQDLESAVYRAKGLTQQLLTFSSGGAPIKTLVDLASLLQKCLQFALNGTAVNYELTSPEDLWLVEADAGQLSQVINNLTMNTLTAMPAGGKLKVTAENIILVGDDKEISLPGGNYVKIVVRDQGSGIPAEILGHIFEPYFTTGTQGHGLGLSIVYSIIQRHSGYIGVESVVGEGSTFTIYLPAALEHDKSELVEAAPPLLKETSNKRVLVLEDEKMLQSVLLKLLKKLGYEVEITEDGTETVEKYQKGVKEGNPYSVLILDLLIPEGKGGLETLKELLQIDPGVKAIVSSGYNADPILANYRNYGFKGVLSKPYTVEQLRTTLAELNH